MNLSAKIRSLSCAACFAWLAPAGAQTAANICAEQVPAGAERGFAAAVARNAPAVVSILILRPRRDPAADFEGLESFQSSTAC